MLTLYHYHFFEKRGGVFAHNHHIRHPEQFPPFLYPRPEAQPTVSMKTNRNIHSAVIITCLVIIALWWYQSPIGPGGRNKYGIIRVSWINDERVAGAGDLVIALSRTPSKDAEGGKLSSISPGLTISPGSSLDPSDTRAIESVLKKIDGGAIGVIDDVDTEANTITFRAITPPQGWPAQANENWTTPTTMSPSSYIRITPPKRTL